MKSIDLSYNFTNDETAKLVSNMIKDGMENINMFGCGLTKQGIATIAGKITKLKTPVNIFIFKRNDAHV